MSDLLKNSLGELIDFKNGKIAPKTEGEFPIYGGNGILGYCDDWNYEDVLIVGRVGAYCGSIHIANGKCWVSDNAIAAIPMDKGLLEFFYFLLGKLNLNKKHIGSSQPLLTQGILNSVDISLIEDLEIRKQIAKVLSDLDAKIEVNNQINQQLEAMAKTLYDYWFVQFDFPDANGKPYKSAGGTMVYNKELKREIPEGWEVDSLSSWIKNDKSGDWGKDAEQGNYVSKVSCIRGADLNGLNGKGDVKAPTRFVLEKNSHKLLEVGDFIIEISGGSPVQSTGRMAFITEETLERFDNPLICSNFCKAVTLENEKAIYNFAYEWNRLYDAGVLFGWEGKTSGIKNLLFESFVTNHKMTIPPSELIEQFHDYAKPIHSKTQKNLQQNQKLVELRDWLLPMLMNGQVQVKSKSNVSSSESREVDGANVKPYTIGDYIDVEEQLNKVAESGGVYDIFQDPVEQRRAKQRSKKNAPKQALILALAIQAHAQSGKNLYRTKGEKLIEIIEKHVVVEFGRNAIKMAAGPASFKHLVQVVEPLASKGNWFHVEEKKKFDGITSHKYVKGENFKPFLTRAKDQFKTQLIEVNRVIDLFVEVKTTRQAEVIATTYSAWNNLILRNKEISKDSILYEARENWKKEKLEIPKQEFKDAIVWLKENRIVPIGNGKEVK